MGKKTKKLLNGLILVLFHVLFWICNYYPKHILEGTSLISIIATLINVLFFVFYYGFLVLLFAKNRCLFSDERLFEDKEEKKDVLKQILVLIALQILLDIVTTSLSNALVAWGLVSQDVLTLTYWLLVYGLLTQNKKNVFRNVTMLWKIVVILLVVLGISLWVDIIWIQEYNVWRTKYVLFAPQLTQLVQNIDFLHNLKSLILDSWIGIVLIVFHMKAVEPDENKDKQPKTMVGFIVGVLIFVTVLLIALKMMLFPDSCLRYFNASIREETLLKEENRKLDLTATTISFERMRGWEDTYVCYQNTISQISEKETILISFQTLELSPPLVEKMEGNQIWLSSLDTDYLIDGKSVSLYEDKVVCYYENGQPVVIRLDKLDKIEKNSTVIQLTELLIQGGNIFAFEYGANYLLEHNRDFIIPYIERYAKGEFNGNEIMWLEEAYYQREYIIEIAKNLLLQS